MRTPIRWFVTLTAVVFLAGACGGGGAENEATGEPDEDVGGDKLTITMEAQDFRFIPTSFEGEPGQDVEVQFQNTGDVAHTFTVPDLDVNVEAAPGGNDLVDFELPEEDVIIEWQCRFHPTQMRGEIFVGDAGEPGGGIEETPEGETGGGSDDIDY